MNLLYSYNKLISYLKRLVKTVSIQQKTEALWGLLLTELEVDDISILDNLQSSRVSFMWCESSCVHLHMTFLLVGTCQQL
jgi:hypothetical protein